MTKTKKIVLFIVEGITDELSLSLILSKIVANYSVQFHLINRDITADFSSSCQNILTKINGEVKKFLAQNNGIKKTDIKEIIHLVDIDGAFIREEFIVDDPKCKKTFYETDCIRTNKRDLIVGRNSRKSSILNRLYKTEEVAGTPYRVFFFSCNLEHILHNNPNTLDSKKSKVAYEFTDRYAGRENDFISYISDNDFAIEGDYKNTWEFIKEDFNSINRYCNFHLFFKN